MRDTRKLWKNIKETPFAHGFLRIICYSDIMPNLITHSLLGKKVVPTLPAFLQGVIADFPKEFVLGTQGPDIFFYYNAWPWLSQKKGKDFAVIGSSIHRSKINEFFGAVLEQLDVQNSTDLHRAKLSYLCGFFCHWALDKSAHPYVFNQTGDVFTKEGKVNHRRFESHLDFFVLQHLENCPLQKYPGYKLIQFDTLTVDAIFEFYADPVLDIHGYDIPKKKIRTALSHFRGIQRALYDPHGKKFRVLYWIEKRLLKAPYLFSSMITFPQEDRYDIVNSDHRTWEHPCTGESSAESFLDLFEKGLQDGTKVLHLLNNFIEEGGSTQELLSFVKNQSFETGLSTLEPMEYFNPIY